MPHVIIGMIYMVYLTNKWEHLIDTLIYLQYNIVNIVIKQRSYNHGILRSKHGRRKAPDRNLR